MREGREFSREAATFSGALEEAILGGIRRWWTIQTIPQGGFGETLRHFPTYVGGEGKLNRLPQQRVGIAELALASSHRK